jgi:hypothetical protein
VRSLTAGEESQRLLVLVGPSGIGKSSVVKAGLIPALRRTTGALGGQYLIADMVPGAHPFEELETTFSILLPLLRGSLRASF